MPFSFLEKLCEVQMKTIGEEIYEFAGKLFPICRSITGNGVRKTLSMIKEYIPELNIVEVPTGTKVFDWTVPKEWNIQSGRIWFEDSTDPLLDFKNSNLHIMGYSTPVDKWMELEELLQYVYTEPKQPDAIPYVTSYYKECFGFCMSHNQKEGLKSGKYHVVIDSELKNGSLTYGELFIQGETSDEIFISTYICHPSMANNECSGPALTVFLAKWIKSLAKRRLSYRIVFVPETIGSITYLSQNLYHLKRHMIAGFNLSCVGDNRDYSMVESRYANTLSDRILKNVLDYHTKSYTIYPFLKRGSDERQYNAPGIDLPVVAFCRSKFGKYPEYHTSKDNMDFITPEGFLGSYEVMTKCIQILEHNEKYKTLVLCEPQLSKRGLYPTVSKKGSYDGIKALTNFIAYADGCNDLIDISNLIGISCEELIPIKTKLLENGLLTIEEHEKHKKQEANID